MRRALCRILALAGVLLAGAVQAETWPERPIKLIVPFPAGGSNDIVGRMFANQLSERLGKQVYVENRGGAGATLGTALAAAAPADGYTLLLISASYTFNPALYRKLPYDPATAFTPVAMLGRGPVTLTVWPRLPVASVAELIALAKAQPGKLNYATAGVGSLQHLASELFRLQAGIEMVHVPYKGGSGAMLDITTGQAEIMLGSLIQTLPLIRDGALKVLGTSGATRASVLPDVPTIAETLPGYEAYNWWGLMAPAGTPHAIVGRLRAELDQILASGETRSRLSTEGAEAVSMSPDAFARFIATETEKWGRVAAQAGIQPE